MKWEIFAFLLSTWPSVMAVFFVEAEQKSYDAVLHQNIRMGCKFSHIRDVSQISVIWQRTHPTPLVDIYRLERGRENHNFTDKQFRSRARLLKDELKNFRAVLELSQVRVSDSGIYQCIVIQDEPDFKPINLIVRAPYTPVRKSIRKISEKTFELCCESHGFPLAAVVWSDGRLTELRLTDRSSSISEMTADGVYKVSSQLNVTSDVNNYTCSFITADGVVNQTATFSIPDEFPKSTWSAGYGAIIVIVVIFVGFGLAALFLHRRKKGQMRTAITPTGSLSSEQILTVTPTDELLPKTDFSSDTFALSSEVCYDQGEKLRKVLQQRNSESDTSSETITLPHTLFPGKPAL